MAEPQSCDTFVVLPPLTQHGVVFGKNSDRPSGEVQEVVYFPAAELSDTIKCTYIDVKSNGATKAVILSKPGWMWGAEMGANECGVVIGSEAVWTNDNEGDSNSLVKRLLGTDLVRLGLERSNSATEALEVMIQLLEEYGQGGPCKLNDLKFSYHNSFLIADPKTAWVLETCGKHWAAEHVTEGYRHISNMLTITTNINRKSDGLLEYAKSKGLWDGNKLNRGKYENLIPCSFLDTGPQSSMWGRKMCEKRVWTGTIISMQQHDTKGEFNFGEAFISEPPKRDGRLGEGKKLLAKLTASQEFKQMDMFTILRDKEAEFCRSLNHVHPTQASQVSVLSSTRPSVHWFTATPDPTLSIFKPFIFTSNVAISKHTICPEEKSNVPHTLYSLHAEAIKKEGNQVQDVLRLMEADCVRELEGVIENLGEDLSELDELFKDCVETEVKFYR